MLRKIRVITAAICFFLLTLLFFDFTGTFHAWFGWMAKVQLIPALLTTSVATIVILAVLTLLFGRVYCSVICPLGVFQDGVSNISGQRKGKKNRFRYSAAKSWLRYIVLGIFIIAMVAGVSVAVSLLDPYAAYGRMTSNLFAPVYRLGNNLLAFFAERVDSYTFYSTDVWIKGWITFGVAAVTLIVVSVLAWRHGRTYCNTICPVGTFLGFLSKFSLLRIAINDQKCTKCKACERACKASCIDTATMSVDHSRCVTCFSCTEKCKFGAIKYVPVNPFGKKKTAQPVQQKENETEGITRRNLLAIMGTMLVASTIKAQEQKVDGGLAVIEDKKIPDRKTPVVPPGALGVKNMQDKCTACQLCVSACPNSVLRPSGKLATLMQPEMSFERGYCRPECVECSHVCPTSAISPISVAEKSAISIGTAVWIKDNCVVSKDGVQCNSCEHHCPTGAITMIERNPGSGDSLKTPVVDKEVCIGCGACEHLCPARPFSAIYVEGNVRHHSV